MRGTPVINYIVCSGRCFGLKGWGCPSKCPQPPSLPPLGESAGSHCQRVQLLNRDLVSTRATCSFRVVVVQVKLSGNMGRQANVALINSSLLVTATGEAVLR